MRPCIVVRPYSRKREVREVFGDLSGTLILHEDPDLPTMDEWSDELAASGALLEWIPRVSDWRGAAGGHRDSGGLAPQSATALGSHGAGATQPVAAQWRHALYTLPRL